MQKKFLLSFIVIAVIILIFSIFNKGKIEKEYEKIRIGLYGNPIDESTQIINNAFFGIDNSGNKECGKQISKAIEYANKNNIEYIKLEKGTYLIDSTTEEKSIRMQDNIVLDLNTSTVIQEANSSPSYSIIKIENNKNVTIKNGIIKGDKNQHDYDSVNSSHQWGIGIDIRGSKDIMLDNIEIYETTGDGVYVANIQGSNKIYVENVTIKNMNIHDCRRQGISIISGDNINIYNNEIHNIKGNSPQAAIDLESNYCNDNTEKINNVKIRENKLYDLGANVAIQLYRYVYNVDIYENEITGNIKGYDGKEKINIYENKIKNSIISFNITEKYSQAGHFVNELNIHNNICDNSQIIIRNVNNATIKNNVIDEDKIKILENDYTEQQEVEYE